MYCVKEEKNITSSFISIMSNNIGYHKRRRFRDKDLLPSMDSFNNDIVIRFASFLCSKDLVNLALTCRRFGSSQLHDTGSSLIEDTAHQIICNAKQEERR